MSYNRRSAPDTDLHGQRRLQADNFTHRDQGHRQRRDIDEILHSTHHGGVGRDWRNQIDIRSSPQQNENANRQGQGRQPRQNEIYPIKGASRNDGLKYEVRIRSALAAQWAQNEKVKNFWIITNPPDVECFDDIIAIVTDRNDTEYLFMIQLKHSRKSMQLVFNNTIYKQNCIPMHKCLECFNNIASGNVNDSLKRKICNIPFENRYFCIFTTMTKMTELSQKDMADDHPLELLDIDNRHVYSKWERNVDVKYQEFSRRLYFLTDQQSCYSILDLLYRIMPAGFDKIMMDALFDLVKETSPLTKHLYCQRCVDVQMSKYLQISRISFRIKDEFLKMWDQIFTNYNQIIIDNEDTTPEISSLLFSFYEYKIRMEFQLGGSFDWNDCYDEDCILSDAVFEVLALKDENLKRVRHLSDLVRYMWITNKIPIMLKERHKQFLTHPLLQEVASGKRFVMASEFGPAFASEQQIKKFRNVVDLMTYPELVKDILAIDISLQGRPKVAIGEIVEGCSDILKEITPSHLFDWTSKSQEIPLVGKSLLQPEENYVKRYFEGATESTLSKERDLTEEQFIRQLTPGLNVIANGPGMGKTTVLHSLAFHYNAADYVLHISNVASCIRDTDCEELMDSPMDYFFKINEGENCSKLIQSIYKSQRDAGRVFLVIDSLDEVSLHYKEKALHRLLEYSNNKTRVLIAARSYAARTLKENYPHLQLFQLRELSDEDIDVYIKKCNLPETIFRKVDPHLLKIPLHLSMISSISNNVIPYNITIVDLYQLFVERKIDVYCRDKKYMKSYDRDAFMHWIHNLHEIAALKVIFDVDVGFEAVIRSKESCMSWGIISSVDDDAVEFVHHTYSEYFAARWIHDNPAKSKQLCRQVFTNENYRQISELLTLIHNKKIDCLATLKKDKCFTEDQWCLLPIHWAVATIKFVDDKEQRAIIKQIKLIIKYMVCVGELSVGNSFDLKSHFEMFQHSLNSLPFYNKKQLMILVDSSRDMCPNDLPVGHTNTRLQEACFNGEIDIVRGLLEEEEAAKVNQPNRNGATSLHAACLGGHEDIVKVLLQHQADVNMKTVKGITSLHAACIGDHEKIVSPLLDCDVDPNQTIYDGSSCLHIASYQGNMDIVQSLLKKADVNKRDRDGMTSLHIACQEGYLNIVDVLLCSNADLNITDTKGNNYELEGMDVLEREKRILKVPERTYNPYRFSPVRKYCSVDENDTGRTSLYIACKQGHYDIVCKLLDCNADPNVKASNGNNSLHIACIAGNEKIVLKLLAYGADPRQISDNGETCLHAASFGGNVNIVKRLLGENLDVNHCNVDGKTCLHYACERGYGDVVDILLDHGADPNIQSKYGYTSLHSACIEGHKDIVWKLLAHGADPNKLAIDKITCLYIAADRGHVDIARLLLEKGSAVQVEGNGDASLHIACKKGHKDLVNLLHIYNANNIKNKSGDTSLDIADDGGHEDIILHLSL